MAVLDWSVVFKLSSSHSANTVCVDILELGVHNKILFFIRRRTASVQFPVPKGEEVLEEYSVVLWIPF